MWIFPRVISWLNCSVLLLLVDPWHTHYSGTAKQNEREAGTAASKGVTDDLESSGEAVSPSPNQLQNCYSVRLGLPEIQQACRHEGENPENWWSKTRSCRGFNEMKQQMWFGLKAKSGRRLMMQNWQQVQLQMQWDTPKHRRASRRGLCKSRVCLKLCSQHCCCCCYSLKPTNQEKKKETISQKMCYITTCLPLFFFLFLPCLDDENLIITGKENRLHKPLKPCWPVLLHWLFTT